MGWTWAIDCLLGVHECWLNLCLISFRLVEEQEPEYAFKKHQQMMEMMNKFEKKIFRQWTSVVGHQIETNLAKPLKKRDKFNFLSLNFDPQV